MRNPDFVIARLGALIALAGLAAGCGPRAQTRTATTTGDAGYRDVMSRTDIRGNAVADEPATRATVVIVFASWCQPCRTELAILRDLVRDRPNLRVIGVNAYEEFDDLSDEQALDAFLREAHPWLTVVRADATLLKSLGGVRKIPSLFVFGRDGARLKEYRRSRRAPPTRTELAALLDPLLG